MTITRDDIESITTAVWATMLDADLDRDPSLGLGQLRPALVGEVPLTGAFQGRVSLHMSEGLIRGAASVMFGVPAAGVTQQQLEDAAAELANMVGGNIKCLVDQPTQLGLPEVSGPGAPNPGYMHEVGFVGPQGSVVVTVRGD